MKIILTIWTLLLTFYAQADHHAEAAPVETWNCSLNEGKRLMMFGKFQRLLAPGPRLKAKKMHNGSLRPSPVTPLILVDLF